MSSERLECWAWDEQEIMSGEGAMTVCFAEPLLHVPKFRVHEAHCHRLHPEGTRRRVKQEVSPAGAPSQTYDSFRRH